MHRTRSLLTSLAALATFSAILIASHSAFASCATRNACIIQTQTGDLPECITFEAEFRCSYIPIKNHCDHAYTLELLDCSEPCTVTLEPNSEHALSPERYALKPDEDTGHLDLTWEGNETSGELELVLERLSEPPCNDVIVSVVPRQPESGCQVASPGHTPSPHAALALLTTLLAAIAIRRSSRYPAP